MTNRIKQYPTGRAIKKLHKSGLKSGGIGFATKRQADYAFGIKDKDADTRRFHDPHGKTQNKTTSDLDKIIKKNESKSRSGRGGGLPMNLKLGGGQIGGRRTPWRKRKILE